MDLRKIASRVSAPRGRTASKDLVLNERRGEDAFISLVPSGKIVRVYTEGGTVRVEIYASNPETGSTEVVAKAEY